MFFARRAERFVSPLHDSLRADVDPRPGRHLAIHHQSGPLEFVELLPVGKMPDQIRVRNQHARRVSVSLEHAHRLPRLHQQRLIVLKILQRADDSVVAIPVASRLTRAAIDNQILRPLGNFLVEIVHQHAQGGFLLPTFAGDRVAARGANAGVRRGRSFDINWHTNMVVRRVRNHQSPSHLVIPNEVRDLQSSAKYGPSQPCHPERSAVSEA